MQSLCTGKLIHFGAYYSQTILGLICQGLVGSNYISSYKNNETTDVNLPDGELRVYRYSATTVTSAVLTTILFICELATLS